MCGVSAGDWAVHVDMEANQVGHSQDTRGNTALCGETLQIHTE